MGALKKLAIERIDTMLDELDRMLFVNISHKLLSDQKLDLEKDVYPLSSKIREIKEWVDACRKKEDR
jgi:hypothetical protein